MQTLRSTARLIAVACLLLWLAVDFLLRPARSSRDGAERVHRCCRRIMQTLGVRWNVTGETLGSGAIVCNHLSYLDILLFAAHRPFIMVAKSEVSKWPLIGWLTRQAGTVFVVRGGGPATYPAVNRAMGEAFLSGLPVLFFPEGTTTDGSCLLPFKRGLLHSVLSESAPLQVSALRYSDASACWWGDATLLPHLLHVAGMKDLRVELRFGSEVLERSDRFELASFAHEYIAQMCEELSSKQIPLAHLHEDLLDRPVESLGALDGHGCVLR